MKYHLKTETGIKNFTSQEAQSLAGSDPDHATRDLFEHIAHGGTAAWKVCIQVMPYEEAFKYPINIFDVTKVWPQKEFPLIQIGRMVLDRNPDNFFAETEQSAFSPSHLVPGIEPSLDKMLQGRLFSYPDTQRHRLGTLSVCCMMATTPGIALKPLPLCCCFFRASRRSCSLLTEFRRRQLPADTYQLSLRRQDLQPSARRSGDG